MALAARDKILHVLFGLPMIILANPNSRSRVRKPRVATCRVSARL